MNNEVMKLLQDLPKNNNIYLSIPQISDMNEFLLSVNNSE